MGVLHLWTIKSPTASAFISHKGNSYQAIEMAEGVNEKRCIKKDLKIFYVVHLEDSYARMTKKRHRKKWTTSEELDLQREYAILELDPNAYSLSHNLFLFISLTLLLAVTNLLVSFYFSH